MELSTSSPDRLYSVVIVGFDDALASSITGAIDMFALAGVAWQRIHQQPIERCFDVTLVSLTGDPIRCINHNLLQPHTSIDKISTADIVMVPTIGGDIGKVLEQTRGLLPHLLRLSQQGCDIASNCTGAFILGNAGLLDNRTVTTHWGYAEQFQHRFPKANLQAQQMITEDQHVFCAGGGMAWFDLVLRLIERYCGHKVAADTAKAHVVDFTRGNQAAYAPLQRRKFHHDDEIRNVQDWIERHYASDVNIQALAKRASMSPRTLIRRFKTATQQTPQRYLQQVRLEHAKRLLSDTEDPIQVIVQRVGYEDLSSFNRLFKRVTGFSPGHYRNNFRI